MALRLISTILPSRTSLFPLSTYPTQAVAQGQTQPTIQLDVDKVPAKTDDYATLIDKNLGDLVKYADAQADWHSKISEKKDRDRLRAILDLARNRAGIARGPDDEASRSRGGGRDNHRQRLGAFHR